MGTNLQKYQTKEVLNKVLNTGEDALKVDLDNVTITNANLEVNLDSANDSVEVIQATAGDLNATVTQASAVRTISGSVAITSATASNCKVQVEPGAAALSITPASVSSTTKTADATIKSGAGNIYSVFVSFVGVTIGNKIELLDNTTVLMTFTATAANESFQFNSHAKIPFSTSLVYDETTDGTITTTVVYD